MVSIVKESDDTIKIEGMTEADFMTLYMIADTVYFQRRAKPELADEALNLCVLLEDFFQRQNGKQIHYLP